MSLPKNAKYTSNLIQNDILEAAAIVVGRNIVNEIKIGSDIFSIIADEARDIGKEEQMSLCIRYVSDCIIKERFLDFILLKDLDAQSLCNTIHKFLVSINLDITKCIAQSYDGASVMPGCNNGVQAKIRELSKNACPYVHCYAHRLNLVLVDTAKKVEALDEIIGLLEAVYAFQSFSTIRHNAFIQAHKDCGKIIEVPQHCETRWFSPSIKVFTFSKNVLKIQKKKRKPLRLVVFYINFLHFISFAKIFSRYYQSTKILLQNMRNEDKFNKLFDESVIAGQELDITIPCNQTATISLSMPRKKMNLPSKLNNSYVYSTIGKNNSLKFKTNIDILTAVDACDPNSSNFMDIEKLKYLVNIYGQDKMCNMETITSQSILVKNMFENTTINIVELHKELTIMKPAFQEINEIVTRVLIIPVTSATEERSFSAMRRIKTYLRSTMTSERLHNTAILSIERELSGQLIQDPTSVIDEFATSKNRRLSFYEISINQSKLCLKVKIKIRKHKLQLDQFFPKLVYGKLLKKAFQKLMAEQDEYSSKGSGYTLQCIDGLLLGVYKYTPMSASSYISLSDFIEKKKAIINPQNSNQQCFKWAILAKHVTGSNKQYIENYTMHEEKYNFSDLTFPIKLHQVNIFEKNNPNLTVNVVDEEKTDHFDLLLITDDENSHFTYISNFSHLYDHRKPDIMDVLYFVNDASHRSNL
ncbi:zinc finger MYM-type protein 1-like, partial [Aphis craccivora]